MTSPDVTIDWAVSTLDFKAQISKSFIIATPYLGLGASTGWSRAGYSVKTTVTESHGDLDRAKELLKAFGIDDLSETGFSSEQRDNGWSFRAYGGFALSIAVLKLEFTGLFNFRDSNYGVTLGARVQF